MLSALAPGAGAGRCHAAPPPTQKRAAKQQPWCGCRIRQRRWSSDSIDSESRTPVPLPKSGSEIAFHFLEKKTRWWHICSSMRKPHARGSNAVPTHATAAGPFGTQCSSQRSSSGGSRARECDPIVGDGGGRGRCWRTAQRIFEVYFWKQSRAVGQGGSPPVGKLTAPAERVSQPSPARPKRCPRHCPRCPHVWPWWPPKPTRLLSEL